MTNSQKRVAHYIQIQDRKATDSDFDFMIWMIRKDADGKFRNYAYGIENNLICNGGDRLQNTLMYWMHKDEGYHWSMLHVQAFALYPN